MRFLSRYRRTMLAQWLERERLKRVQALKLKRLVRHAYDTVPYYRWLMDDAGLDPSDVTGPQDLARIPITTKSDLRDQSAEALISRRADRRRLCSERSSGSSGTPFTVHYDQYFKSVRQIQFLRALHAAGYRPGRRILLVTGRKRASTLKRWLGWHYASIEEPPEKLLERLRAVRPDLLYGCLTPLRLLAQEVERSESGGWPLRAVITTAETLDAETRGLLERVFHCGVFDQYGLTEMGLVGWECAEQRGYHLCEDAVLVESVASVDGGPSRLVMTNLNSMAMPFIRYDSGDVGVLGGKETCPCGRSSARLERIEGRLADCVRLEDGRSVTPYALTCRLEQVQGVRRFQIVQKSPGAFTVRVVSENGGEAVRHEEIRSVLRSVLGREVEVEVKREARIEPAPGKKFRVVESFA